MYFVLLPLRYSKLCAPWNDKLLVYHNCAQGSREPREVNNSVSDNSIISFDDAVMYVVILSVGYIPR